MEKNLEIERKAVHGYRSTRPRRESLTLNAAEAFLGGHRHALHSRFSLLTIGDCGATFVLLHVLST